MQGSKLAPRLATAAPALFVLLWSTGFIGAKLGAPYAEPFTFLSLRVALVLALLLPLAFLLRVRWPATPMAWAHIAVAGAFLHGGYLAGCFAAVYHGMSAGVIALIVGLQPIVTSLLAAPVLGERVGRIGWIGLALGFGGVVLVVWQKASGEGITVLTMSSALIALISITAGTLYQKRFCPVFDLRAGTLIQFGAALLLLAPAAFLTETRDVVWSGEFVFALLWLVVVLSLGAVTLLHVLLQRGAATRVASLFYLTPVTTALIAHFMFGETFGVLAMIGMASTVIGVALVNRS